MGRGQAWSRWTTSISFPQQGCKAGQGRRAKLKVACSEHKQMKDAAGKALSCIGNVTGHLSVSPIQVRSAMTLPGQSTCYIQHLPTVLGWAEQRSCRCFLADRQGRGGSAFAPCQNLFCLGPVEGGSGSMPGVRKCSQTTPSLSKAIWRATLQFIQTFIQKHIRNCTSWANLSQSIYI